MTPLSVSPAPFEMHPLPDGAGFRLVGELDIASAPELRRVLGAFDSEDGTVLDLSELTFIDSSGCHALVSYLGASDDGRRLVLVEASSTIARTLELTGLRSHPAIEIQPARA